MHWCPSPGVFPFSSGCCSLAHCLHSVPQPLGLQVHPCAWLSRAAQHSIRPCYLCGNVQSLVPGQAVSGPTGLERSGTLWPPTAIRAHNGKEREQASSHFIFKVPAQTPLHNRTSLKVVFLHLNILLDWQEHYSSRLASITLFPATQPFLQPHDPEGRSF